MPHEIWGLPHEMRAMPHEKFQYTQHIFIYHSLCVKRGVFVSTFEKHLGGNMISLFFHNIIYKIYRLMMSDICHTVEAHLLYKTRAFYLQVSQTAGSDPHRVDMCKTPANSGCL